MHMPNYFIYTYATAAILSIVLAATGLSPGLIDYGMRDYSIFIGLLSYAYFLSIALMVTLLIPRFRGEILERLGKRLIFLQVFITVPFIIWGSVMITSLISRHGL